MSEQFYHLQRTIIFFNSKISSISNCWVLLSHLIHVENDLPKFIWIASCQCLDMFFYDKFTTFPLLSQLFYAEYLTLLLFQWFRQGDLSIKLKNVLPQLIRSSSFFLFFPFLSFKEQHDFSIASNFMMLLIISMFLVHCCICSFSPDKKDIWIKILF